MVPLVRDGIYRANLVVTSETPRQWQARELTLLETIADRTWNTLEKLRAAEALRTSQASLALALQAGQAGTFEWDVRNDINRWSPELEALYGVSPGSFESNYNAWSSRVEPADVRAVELGLRATFDGQQPEYNYEFRAILPNGARRWLAGRARFDYDTNGVPLWMRGLNVDIHERKQAELNAQFLLDLDAQISRLGEAAAIEQQVVELLGRYLDVSRCYFGHIEGERVSVRHEWRRGDYSAIGSYQLVDYFSPEAIAQFRSNKVTIVEDVSIDSRTAAAVENYQALDIGAYVTTPVVLQGEWVGALNVVSPQPHTWHANEVQLLRDVAARVWPWLEQARARAALRESEARLQVLYEQEQTARQQAEEASRLKDDFLATVSHELRTPLTSILGYSQLLRMRKYDEAYTARTIEKIVRSAQSQAQIIEDLLDVSRIVTGKLRIESNEIEMVSVIHAAIDVVRPALEAKAVRLETALDSSVGPVLGDTNRLQQVVANLLSNAVKFTPTGGAVRVVWQREQNIAHLSVSDTGQGISAEFLPFVFDRFRQAESASNRRNGGLGLGLSIVRHLVEMHGGTVHVASPGIGHGATFTVQLPLAPDRNGASNPGSNNDSADESTDDDQELAGLRVLVVDDQLDILVLIHEVLTASGAEVRTSNAAQDGLAILRAWRPDVLVSDIAMPNHDGYWLIERVRALPQEAGGATPAAALTAYVRLEERVRVLEAGFQIYIPKPVEPNELRKIVGQLAHARLSQ